MAYFYDAMHFNNGGAARISGVVRGPFVPLSREYLPDPRARMVRRHVGRSPMLTLYDRIASTVALGILVTWLVIIAIGMGPLVTPDAGPYSLMARALVAGHYNPLTYLAQNSSTAGIDHPVWVPFYLTYIYVFALAQSAFGDNWPAPLVAFNVIVQSLTAALLLHLVWWTTTSRIAVVVTFAALLVLVDFHQWVAMTQSDPLFVLLGLVAVMAVLRATLAQSGPETTIWWAVGLTTLLLAVFTRPAWPPLIMAVGAAAGAARLVVASQPVLRAWILTGAVGAVGALLAGAKVYTDPTVLPDGALRDLVVFYGHDIKEGIVVLARPDTYVGPVTTTVGILGVMLARLVQFFAFAADGFSDRHRLVNIAGHVPLYVLALFGVGAAVGRRLPSAARAMAMVAIVWIVAVALYQAATLVDFDWRYRAPVYPALIYLAALGAESLRRRERKWAAVHG